MAEKWFQSSKVWCIMKVQQCKKCKTDIVFLKTKKGKAIPVDYDSITHADMTNLAFGDVVFRYGEHIAHFATCPEADSFRKKDQ